MSAVTTTPIILQPTRGLLLLNQCPMASRSSSNVISDWQESLVTSTVQAILASLCNLSHPTNHLEEYTCSPADLEV